MNKNKKIYDVLIIGSGPNGLACGVAARKAGLDFCIIEKGGFADAIRRFPVDMAWFSTTDLLEIGDIPFTASDFHPTRQQSLHYYQRVCATYDMPLALRTCVDRIEKTENCFTVHTSQGRYFSNNVIVATGYYDSPNNLGIEGEGLPHVTHYYDEPYAYHGLKVVVVGAQNSAIDAALELFRSGVDVTLVHRGEHIGEAVKYWIKPDIENRLKKKEIKSYFNSEIQSIDKQTVSLKNKQTGDMVSIPADQVFILTGYRPDPKLLSDAGVKVNADTLEVEHNPETFETNIEGLFVAGSVVSGKFTNKIFVENGRLHGAPIIDHICRMNRKEG